MNAQAEALSSISNNVANSQTIGFKGTNTSFQNYVTEATATTLSPGAVVATPHYTNTVQGTVTQVSNPTSLAITGNGFFAVQKPTSADTFSSQQYYTRAGDFSANSDGYLINSAGYALDGWAATDSTGTTFNTSTLSPIQINTSPSAPVATSTVTLAANLPSTPPSGTTSYSNTVQVYDAGGNQQDLTLNWTQAASNQWDLSVTSGTTTSGPYVVNFGTTAATAGTITSITGTAGQVPAAQATGDAATISLTEAYGEGSQAIALNLGTFGDTGGVTQFAGSEYSVTSQTQDGAPIGNYTGVTINSSGNVIVSYDNGTTSTVAQIPLTNFNNADALQSENGQAYSATLASGSATTVQAGTGGTGSMVVGAQEGSNVDIATQFTQMIVAQQAYTANSKVITTANQMLQTAVNMIQG
jgi:flagellar hook protein FlgE